MLDRELITLAEYNEVDYSIQFTENIGVLHL